MEGKKRNKFRNTEELKKLFNKNKKKGENSRE